MYKYKAIIEYDGGFYHGMQKQDDVNIKSVQSALEEAVSKFANAKIDIDYAGRTDTGVHALGQVIDFVLPEKRPCINVLRGINFYLIKQQEKIVIKSVEFVDMSFNSRFSAKKRVYLYRILNQEVMSPLLENRVFHCKYELDFKKMKKVCKMLVGKKMDFSSFCNAESVEFVNTFKTIDKIKIIKQKHSNEVHFVFEAKSFLHNMIRIISGLLVDIGRGKINEKDVLNILKQKKRSNLTQTLPACGLYFLEVKY